MAKAPDKKKDGPVKATLKSVFKVGFVVMILAGFGGFGAANLTGSTQSLGRVGNVVIDARDYNRSLQREKSALEASLGETVSFARAEEMGLPDRVLRQLVGFAAFDNEMAEIGIGISDVSLRSRIVSIDSFSGPAGDFDQDTYKRVLEANQLSDAEFERSVRSEMARGLLLEAILSGTSAPAGYTDSMVSYLGEVRQVSWTSLGRGNLTSAVPIPRQADITEYYERNIAEFTLPEAKRITYAWLTPQMIAQGIDIGEAEIRKAYEIRLDEFSMPERRTAHRLVFSGDAAAADAARRIRNGEATFEGLVAERDLELSEIRLREATRTQLGDAADAVFSAAEGEVVGPIPGDVGPALFLVGKLLAAQTTEFEEVRDGIREDLALEISKAEANALFDQTDDMLAGGATLEELANETEMQIAQIDWRGGETDGLAADEAFIAKAAAVTASDYPEIFQLTEGGFAALRLDETVAPAPQPLAEIRADVAIRWDESKVMEMLGAQVSEQIRRIEAGAGFAEAGLPAARSERLTRQAVLPALPAGFVQAAFEMKPGDVRSFEDGKRLYLARLESIGDLPESNEQIVNLRAVLNAQVAAAIGQDMQQALAADIEARTRVTIDQATRNSVHATFN